MGEITVITAKELPTATADPVGEGLEEAVRRAQDGDEASFHHLVEQLGPSVYRFLVVRLGHEGDAKDALQETLIAAWRGLPGLKRPDRVRSWLMTIAVRKAAEASRARPVPVEVADGEHLDADGFSLIDVREALDALPLTMREALLVHCLLGFSERETAAALGVPVGTVKSRVSRARVQFAKLLSEPSTTSDMGEHDV